MLFIENQLGRQAGGGVEMETCRLVWESRELKKTSFVR